MRLGARLSSFLEALSEGVEHRDRRVVASPVTVGDDTDGAGTREMRVVRGGAWFAPALYCRCATRDWYAPDSASEHYGFRMAVSPP